MASGLWVPHQQVFVLPLRRITRLIGCALGSANRGPGRHDRPLSPSVRARI